MILKELSLKNYRVFRDELFSFSDRVTVLAGVNGRGKSSVLDAIALMLSRLLPQISPAKHIQLLLNEKDVTHGQLDTELNAALDFAGYPLTFTGALKLEGKASFDLVLPQLREEIRKRYKGINFCEDAHPLAVYYTTDRAICKMPRSLSASKSSLLQGMEFAYKGALSKRAVDFKDFMAHFLNMINSSFGELSKDEEGNYITTPIYYKAEAVESIQKAITYFLPQLHYLKVLRDPLRLVINKDNDEFHLTDLSDGERSLIAMVIDLSKRLAMLNPFLNNPLEGCGVVLIDEIELHLHPKWQREIIEKFRTTFPNIQFIMTTHSPFVIQSVRDGELISLDGEIETEYANQNIVDVAEDIMGVEIPQRSKRYVEMMEVASQYYRKLKDAETDANVDVADLKRRLDAISVRYSNDPFFAASLNFEWETFLAKKELAEL